jgi:hypothetical protein
LVLYRQRLQDKRASGTANQYVGTRSTSCRDTAARS